jgi:hypothetical protein
MSLAVIIKIAQIKRESSNNIITNIANKAHTTNATQAECNIH